MKILSIETSSDICAVCILEDKTKIKEITLSKGRTHSETLLPIINQIFTETNITLDDIDLLVCDIGPGSFTGIRIGVSTIKAFIDSKKIPSIGISSLETLAYNVSTEGIICPIIDAKNNQVYTCIYNLHNNVYTLEHEPFTDDISVILNLLKEKNTNITFVGDGIKIYQQQINNAFKDYKLSINFSENNDLNAYNLGIAGYNKFINNEICDVLPLYLKKPQAEREYERKTQNYANN